MENVTITAVSATVDFVFGNECATSSYIYTNIHSLVSDVPVVQHFSQLKKRILWIFLLGWLNCALTGLHPSAILRTAGIALSENP